MTKTVAMLGVLVACLAECMLAPSKVMAQMASVADPQIVFRVEGLT